MCVSYMRDITVLQSMTKKVNCLEMVKGMQRYYCENEEMGGGQSCIDVDSVLKLIIGTLMIVFSPQVY